MIKRLILMTVGAFSIICIAYFACSISEGEIGEFTDSDSTTVSVLPVSGAALWLRADRGICSSTPTLVNSWQDQTVNGNNAVAIVKPEWVDNVINEKPVVRFSGIQYMLMPEFMSFSNVTFFVVGSFPQQATDQYIFFDYGDDTDKIFYIRVLSALNTIQFRVQDAAGDPITISSIGDSSDYHILTARLNGQNSELFYNGVSDNSGTNGSYDDTTTWDGTTPGRYPTIGKNSDPISDDYLTGDIAEIIIFPSALSDPERVKIECYLSNKYGIPISGCEL
jgi:hypothetical protein